MTKFLTTFTLTALMSLSALADTQSPSLAQAQKLFWNLNLPQTNSCARQSVEPAQGLFMYIDAFNLGRAALRIAQKSQLDAAPVVQTVWNELPKATFMVSRDIFNGLISGQLPLLDGSDSSVASAKRQVLKISETSVAQCLLIKKTIPLQMNASNVNKQDMESLASAYMQAQQYLDTCENISNITSMPSRTMLRFDLNNQSDKMTFEFWSSFKIYLNIFWNRQVLTQYGLSYASVLGQFPIQESVVLIPEGCRSLSKPECNTEFLSQSQLGQLLSEKTLASSASLLQTIGDKELQTFSNKVSPNPSERNDYTDLLANWTKLKHQSALQLYEAQRKMTIVFHQADTNKLMQDLTQQLNSDPEAVKELASACQEVQVIGSKDISPLATELVTNKNIIESLKRWPFPGAPLDISLAQTKDLVSSMTVLCKKMLPRFLKQEGGKGSRPWMKQYFSSQLSADIVDVYFTNDTSTHDANASYISIAGQTVCATPLICIRDLVESYQKIYQVALQQTSLLSKQVLSTSLNRSLGSTVACKIFDPWAESQLRYKKLMLDATFAVVGGFTGIPIFLNIEPTTERVISFQQLLDQDQVKLDPVFADRDWKKTAMLDLGQLANAPCTIAISNSQNINIADPILLFKGISTKLCTTSKDGSTTQNSIGITGQKNKERSMCGQCSLNFERVALTQVRNSYSLMRGGLRLLSGMIDFFKNGQDPLKSKKELNINPRYAAQAFNKNEGKIPDECMYELTNGAPCMKNLCVSKTVANFETKFGLQVEKAALNTTFMKKEQYITVNVKGCSESIDVPVVCNENQAPSILNLNSVVVPNSCKIANNPQGEL